MRTTGIAGCLITSNSTEWYTPRKYVDAAREVMGSYNKRWHGNVWLNPPYGFDGKQPNQSRWSQRLMEYYHAGITHQAILLVNAKTGDKWFQPLWYYPICFPSHRIDFYRPDGKGVGSTHGSCLVYLGENIERFRQIFRQFGRVVLADPDSMPPVPSLWTVMARC